MVYFLDMGEKHVHKTFWIWFAAVTLLVLFGPSLISILFVTVSNYIHPLYFIAALVALAAAVAWFGGIGRS